MAIPPRLLAIGALCCALAPAQALECPAEVRVSFPDFEIAPLVLGTDQVEDPPGLLVQWTRAALALTGCDITVTVIRRPPNRQLAEIALGRLDILPGFAYSTALEAHMAFPMRDGAIDGGRVVMADHVSLYARSGDATVKWDGTTLATHNPRVGSSTGGVASAIVARRHGWDVELAPTPGSSLRKLLAKRVDVILEADVVLAPFLTGQDARRVRKLSPPAMETRRYAPVRRGFQQRYPEFTQRFWLELCKQSRATYTTLPACR